MKKYLPLICLFAILVSGCGQEEWFKNQSLHSECKTFTASFEQNESRTYFEEGNLLRWTEGDKISLFDENTLNSQYKFDGETGDDNGTFSKVGIPYGSGNPLTANYAVYPYASNVKISNNGVVATTLPIIQSYAVNSCGLGANTMVAVTKDTNDTFLMFKNVGGYLKLQLYGDNVTIKSILLTGNNNEKLAGKASITPAYGQDPVVTMDIDAAESVTLDCGEGVKIGTSAETATSFWLVVPPTTFENGFTVTIKDVNDNEFTKSTSKKISIERNVIKPISAFEVEVQTDNIPYVTFTADAEQTLTMSKAVTTLEYSVNCGEWNTLGTTTVTFGGKNGNLRLRGKSSTGTANSYFNYAQLKFGTAVNVACYGDIRTLIDYENYTTTQTSNARFCSLFNGCTSLTQAPELPATTLADDCYESMFKGCTSLTQAPELPATTLADDCYESMFESCTSLTQAPELPATNLADMCYFDMFFHCTNLTQAPELPATTLADGCYRNMFYHCTNLTQAPKLPATTLANSCYNGMFFHCTSLTQAPELPATNLADMCYYYMFGNCTNLTQAPKLPATTLAISCYGGMFYRCTSLTQAPELPTTTLVERCYADMFNNCTNLAQAPKLSATILATYCYAHMFYQCSKLNDVTMLATNIEADNCLTNWLLDVSPTGSFTKSALTTSLPIGPNGIPDGWTVEDYSEE